LTDVAGTTTTVGARVALRAGIAALAFAALFAASSLTPRASALGCDRVTIGGAGPSTWRLEADANFDEAALFSRSLGFYRADAFDGYGTPWAGGLFYANPQEARCSGENGGQEWAYATDTLGTVKVTPKLYADPRRPFGRQYFSIKNTTAGPIVIDIGFMNGNFGSDSNTEIDRTSSGDGTVTPADSWATSCEDNDLDGCTNVVGEAVRDPELAHTWERASGAEQNADVISLADGSDSFEVEFDDVPIPAGKTIALMGIVTLALDITDARKAAARAANNPADAGVFRGLSKKERKRLVNF
jgi:hypothetical protein